ncbi:MAG: YceI family protein [Rhodocyclaceae bacterium]|nr:YceI family protein [Rhodocyclaceae bacterium]
MTRSLIGCLLGLTLVVPAMANEYSGFRPGESRVSFVSTQMNVPVEGRFKRFDGSIHFDPDAPAGGSAHLEVELASIDTGLEEADEEVASAEWFDIAQHPKAIFASSSVEPLGNQLFRIHGQLTIKGKTREIVTDARFEPGAVGAFSGSFKLLRSDYAIGEGMWSDTSVVADEVEIRFRIAAPAQ